MFNPFDILGICNIIVVYLSYGYDLTFKHDQCSGYTLSRRPPYDSLCCPYFSWNEPEVDCKFIYCDVRCFSAISLLAQYSIATIFNLFSLWNSFVYQNKPRINNVQQSTYTQHNLLIHAITINVETCTQTQYPHSKYSLMGNRKSGVLPRVVTTCFASYRVLRTCVIRKSCVMIDDSASWRWGVFFLFLGRVSCWRQP